MVLKRIQGRAQVDSPHGRTTLGILIFQDIIIPMILITPLLAGATRDSIESVIIVIAKGIGIIALVVVIAKFTTVQRCAFCPWTF